MSYALITGASKGIGKAIATKLAAQKIDLLLIARSAELLDDLANELKKIYQVKVYCLSIDLSLPNAGREVFDWCLKNRFQVYILVNNAGYGLAGPFEKFTWPQQRDMLSVNLLAPVELIHHFLPMLKKEPAAYILNIVSTAAYQALPGLSAYAASKAFLLNFSRGLKYELRKSSVSVTALSPGSTDTDFVNRADMGPRARKNAEKFNMSAAEVAEIAVQAMFAKKTEVITGFANKFGAFLAWALPKKIVEGTAAGFYD